MNTCSLREITKTNLESPTLLSPRTKSKTAYTSLQDQKLHARHRIFFFAAGHVFFSFNTTYYKREFRREGSARHRGSSLVNSRIGVNSSETRWTGISFFLAPTSMLITDRKRGGYTPRRLLPAV
uniref:Uncharacterized protein n=1 Tax=Rhipicephalus microplus TaxID=6941 RepID=A0A6G5AGD2_RHIMP